MDRRWPLAALAAALPLITAPAAFAADSDPPPSAGWHGREIREPLPPPNREVAVRFPSGWSAGGVARGAGYTNPDGSRRVREVQRRLVRRGYRPGPVDGRFGARTRAAVLWFQAKHGLPRTGRIDADNIATLRETREMERTRSTAPAPTQPAAAEPPGTRDPADGLWLLLLALVILPGATLIALWAQTRHRERSAPAAEEEPRPRLTGLRQPAPTDVLGYVAVARDEHRTRELDTSARIIGGWCEARGWPLARVVHDVVPTGGRMTDRPGLAHALGQIADGHVAGVVVARLGDVSHSISDTASLMEWIDRAGGFLIAIDHDVAPTASRVNRPNGDRHPATIRGRWDA